MDNKIIKKPSNIPSLGDSLNYYFDFDKSEKNKLSEYIFLVNEINYRPWIEAKGISVELGLDPIKAWGVAKALRNIGSQNTSVFTDSLKNFSYVHRNTLDEFLHNFDMNFGGESGYLSDEDRNRFVYSSIANEAYASSTIEGARTTKQRADDVMKGRENPINDSERMIRNNQIAMLDVVDKYCKQKLSLELLIDIHKQLVDGLKDDDKNTPHLRHIGQEIYVTARGKTHHKAPKIEFVMEQLNLLFIFANSDEMINGKFMHPVIKASIIHFWIGYLHAFTDGNGRLARVIFYWYLLRNNYPNVSQLSISPYILKMESDYEDAYLHTEQDNNDLTYFVDYQIKTLKKAIDVSKEKQKKILDREKSLGWMVDKYNLNNRQVSLIAYLSEKSENYVTLASHANTYSITDTTASRDLAQLIEKDLITRIKKGRSVKYIYNIKN